MWCKNCNIETNEEKCPICGEKTVEDYPTEVYWCDNCRVPVMQEVNQADKGICQRCGKPMKYLAADIRPVFPEERLLIEILLKKKPHQWINESVWASNNRYYINGKSVALPNKLFQKANADEYIEKLERNKDNNSYEAFDRYIDAFVEANRTRLNYLIDESHTFVRKTAAKFPEENIVLSFSGGKDSTVTADVAIKALSDPSLVHIFGNTTLEFPLTIEYAKRYRKNNPQSIFKIAENHEQVFRDVCEDIGPPARMMRWCCSMFKTGPITRVINSLYRDQRILTFYGIRKSESVSRSKYNRVEDDAESVKIQQQTVASPIFFWKDMDIWLYILAEKIDFKCNNDRDKLNIERGGLEKERERADTERQNLTLLDEKNRKTQMYLTYARKIYEELENVYRTSEEEIRNRLQDTINDIFKQIYEGGLSLTIDSKYHITVQANDYEGDVETSTAQSISVIFAFITGIIKMARENRNASDDDAKLLSSEPYPLVMDAPLSAFDKRRIKTVCEALPETAEQVIIFIKDTDGELAEDYMGNRIGSRHQFDKKNEFETNLV